MPYFKSMWSGYKEMGCPSIFVFLLKFSKGMAWNVSCRPLGITKAFLPFFGRGLFLPWMQAELAGPCSTSTCISVLDIQFLESILVQQQETTKNWTP